jgi:hypothetical protein
MPTEVAPVRLSRNSRGSGGEERTPPEQIEAGATLRGSLQKLEPGDLPLRPASSAASIAIGAKARGSAAATAASTRGPPNVLHRGSRGIWPGRSQRRAGCPDPLPEQVTGSAATAARAGAQPGQRCPSAAPRPRVVDLPPRVRRKPRPVPLARRPIGAAHVVILEPNLPPLERLAVPVALAGVAIEDLRALLALAVDARPRTGRVFRHRDDVAVADRPPVEGDQLLAVGGPREADVLDGHRQRDLAHGVEHAGAPPLLEPADAALHAQGRRSFGRQGSSTSARSITLASTSPQSSRS